MPPSPTVFVSYSHSPDDEVWKDRLVRHLKSLEREGFEVWHDRRIDGGADWQPEIARAMERAVVAVLLVSADFLGSEFIRETEVPYLLGRRRAGTLTILPLLARPCDWHHEAWLAGMQCRPQDGIPLSAGTPHQVDEALAALTSEIRALLGRGVPPMGATLPVPEGRAGVPPPWEGEGWVRGEARRGAVRTGQDPDAPIRLDLGRLPTSGPLFVGRESELAQLDAAWEAPATHVLTFVAFGGVGKSTLVARWLDRMAADDWRGALRVLDWSFYSQGTAERVTVEGLRKAGQELYLPLGLLAWATLYRLRRNQTAAAADLSEALEIAERGGMRLHACDAHLGWARLEIQQGDAAAAGKHVAAARQLVDETGYKRREREVAWLEGRAGQTSVRR